MRRRAMIARLALIAGISLVPFGYTKCVFVSNTGGTIDNGMGNGGSGGSGSGTFSTTLELHDSAGVATTDFVFGESIRFDLEARNLSSQPVTLTFPTTQIYDFVVFDSTATNLRWRWSDNMEFQQVATQLRFEPNSSKAY